MRFGSLSPSVIAAWVTLAAPNASFGQPADTATSPPPTSPTVAAPAPTEPPATIPAVVEQNAPPAAAPAPPPATQPVPIPAAQPAAPTGAPLPTAEAPPVVQAQSAPPTGPAPADVLPPAQPVPPSAPPVAEEVTAPVPPPATPAVPTPPPAPWGVPGQPAGPPAAYATGWEQPALPSQPMIIPRTEEGGLGYWPVTLSVGFGGGWAFDGTRSRNAALTVQPSAFLGVMHNWVLDHGPSLAVPIGIPALGYDLNFALVPGYQVMQRVSQEFFWGGGIGVPLIVQPEFLPGLEVNVMAAYRIGAGLGVFARVAYDTYFCSGSDSCFSLSTFGAEAGAILYWEWFDTWEPPPPPPETAAPTMAGYGTPEVTP